MGVTLLRQPPPDASAGLMVVRFRQANYRAIFQRLHTNTTDPASVVAAFNDYAALVKVFYNNEWKIDLTSLYHVVSGIPRRFPVAVAPQVTGTGSTATTGIAGVTRKIFTFVTEANNKAPVKYEAMGGVVPTSDYFVSSSDGGTAAEQDLVAFLTDVTGIIVGHDGHFLQGVAHVTTPLATRDRRKGMRVA
jgi:hypothetical protein